MTRDYRRPAASGRLAALLGGWVAVLAAGTPASAQTLEQALANAYAANPTLEAQRAQLRATDELVPQALSGYRPSLEATGSVGTTRQSARTSSSSAAGASAASRSASGTINPRTASLSLVQPLYTGGQTEAGTRRAESLVQAQRASLLSTEQTVLLDAATAYIDVVRDQAVVALNGNNEQVLRRQLDASRDRFNVGEITRTDVSQAESRLSRAIADRIQSEGQLSASRAVYARVVGSTPGRLTAPKLTFALPSTRDETVALSESNNPSVVAAEFSETAARNAVDQVSGELLPSVSLRGTLSRSYDSSLQTERSDGASVVAQLTIPLYQAGSVSSRVREAKQTAGQRRIEIDEARRQTVENAIRAWEALTTARASIQSRQSQVRAAEIALEGVRQEALVGSRTTLDTLDAEQELLDARVSLVQSQRDEIVAAFNVLAATGQLTAQQLALPVQYYDYQEHYRAVRDKWWGTSVDK
jgi:outer membrane protein/adhesin transport system outer membrane protein